MMDKTYIEIVRLLLEVAPTIFETPHFAMKGGTAINLFVENMPRLSVDIDVVYTNHMLGTGIEPALLSEPEPKSGASANSATRAGKALILT